MFGFYRKTQCSGTGLLLFKCYCLGVLLFFPFCVLWVFLKKLLSV